MWQLCISAYQYKRQQNCECGNISTHCRSCVTTQTPKTEFVVHHLNHKKLPLMYTMWWFVYGFFDSNFEWLQRSWQYQYLANLLLIAHSYNSISSSDKVTFAARTSAILVLKVHPLLSMNWRVFLVDSWSRNSLIPFMRTSREGLRQVYDGIVGPPYK